MNWKGVTVGVSGLALAALFLGLGELRVREKAVAPAPQDMAPVLSVPEVAPSYAFSGPKVTPPVRRWWQGPTHAQVNATTEPACFFSVIFSPKDLDAFPDAVLSCAETCMEAGRCQE